MRSLFLIVLMIAWLPALDLTVNGSFNTTEEQDIVFSYADLLGKCTVSETPDRFKIESLEPSGTIHLATSSGGPWTVAAEDEFIVPGQFIKFDITTNVTGTQSMMSVRACLGATTSSSEPIRINIAPLPDRITAISGIFTQPTVAPVVTEDTPFTFTFADLVTTLHVTEPDAQAFELVITTLSSGTLTTTLGAPITLPYHLASGGSFQWQADADVFTRDGEAAIAAFKVQAANTVAPLDKTAVVTFSTHIVGVTEAPSGVPSTLTSFDPVRVVQGSMVEYTIDELLAHCNGFSDPDRTGSIIMTWETSPGEGSAVHLIDDVGSITIMELTAANMPATLQFRTGDRVRFIMPTNAALGTRTIGNVYVSAAFSSEPSSRVAFRYDVRSSSGGSDGSGAGEGGGGGCGAGLTSVLIALVCISAGLRRGTRRG